MTDAEIILRSVVHAHAVIKLREDNQQPCLCERVSFCNVDLCHTISLLLSSSTSNFQLVGFTFIVIVELLSF